MRDGCKGKVRHRDQTAAVAALKRIGNAGLSSYRCDKCGKWVDSIDRLAPYHMEANWCRRCEGLGSKEAKP